ncbi:MAG: thymidine kinase, partial [Pseudomonadota bacterium]
MILAPSLDNRYGSGKVTSRIGIDAEAQVFDTNADLLALIAEEHVQARLDCVLIDEAQFLTREQVFALGRVCDDLGIPVLAYGLRTDFRGEPFEGSRYLLAWADNLKEIKAICHCGKKATMVVRQDADGTTVTDGQQVEIGGNDRYVSLCRRHFNASFHGIGAAID